MRSEASEPQRPLLSYPTVDDVHCEPSAPLRDNHFASLRELLMMENCPQGKGTLLSNRPKCLSQIVDNDENAENDDNH